MLIHPLSKQEVRRYENDEGRKKAESKLATYMELDFPEYPKPSDDTFRIQIPEASDFNERVDNCLLYSAYENRVDILITEDKGIHTKARRLGIDDRVFTIDEGRDFFETNTEKVVGLPSIQKLTVDELNIDDPIFDSLKNEYDNFVGWFEGHPERDAYVSWGPNEKIGAILILKPDEAEEIGDNPKLSKKERLKISTLKVAEERRGSKAGELLISIAIREAIRHGLEEIYLTHRIKQSDYLVKLISQYGFQQASQKSNGESVFLKRLTPGLGDDPDPFETSIRFYPSFYDGERVDKYLVPIRPQWHDKLFTAYEKRQPQILEFAGQFSSEGNSIKKAYLSNANIRKIERSDILLFYRSRDHQEITSLGVCERVEYDVTDPEEIREIVGRLSVFTDQEIEEIAGSPTVVIRFKWHFDLSDPIHYQLLREEDILKGGPQAIQELTETDYKFIRRRGGIDERFTIN